jgi:hypothetical protein
MSIIIMAINQYGNGNINNGVISASIIINNGINVAA